MLLVMLQNSCVEDTWAKKFPWVGLVMTKYTKVQTSSLKRTLFRWHPDLWRTEKGKPCNCSQTTWYHDSFTMDAKTDQMASCFIVWLYNTNGFRTETMYDYYITMKSMFFCCKIILPTFYWLCKPHHSPTMNYTQTTPKLFKTKSLSKVKTSILTNFVFIP